jgi:hypothetical protein
LKALEPYLRFIERSINESLIVIEAGESFTLISAHGIPFALHGTTSAEPGHHSTNEGVLQLENDTAATWSVFDLDLWPEVLASLRSLGYSWKHWKLDTTRPLDLMLKLEEVGWRDEKDMIQKKHKLADSFSRNTRLGSVQERFFLWEILKGIEKAWAYDDSRCLADDVQKVHLDTMDLSLEVQGASKYFECKVSGTIRFGFPEKKNIASDT